MNKFHGIDLETSPKWLKDNIIVISEGGSHSYGLATETSDLDLRGIAIEPKSHVLGFSQNFEQFQYVTDDVDVTIFGLRKFCKLASACNPNVLELLFVEPHSIKFETGYYNILRENRQLFLSQKARDTFLGYAISQLHKIRLKSEVGKTGKRVESIKKFGFDVKHGLHLVRLLKMCEELLTTGELNVSRKDREELLAIRNGSLKLEDLIKWADSKEKEIRDIKSVLPKLPDIHKIDKLCIELLEKKWESQKNV